MVSLESGVKWWIIIIINTNIKGKTQYQFEKMSVLKKCLKLRNKLWHD